MAIAVLEYKKKNSDLTFILDSSSLSNIDSITQKFHSQDELILSSRYTSLIRQFRQDGDIIEGKILLSYVKDNNDKIPLNILFDDPFAICTRVNSMEEDISEVEKARKLLYSSRNQLFMKLFLQNNNLKSTTSHTVKMSFGEYKIAKKEGLHVFTRDGEYYIPISDVFLFRLGHTKFGKMRLLIEDTLEAWRNNILNMPYEDLYFFSRELRLLINEYEKKKIPKKMVTNLNTYGNNLINKSFNLKKTINYTKARGLIKVKS